MAQTHAALLAPVWLHYPFKDSALRFQSCPEPLLISGSSSRAARSAAPSSPPIRFNLSGVQLPECNSTSLSTPTSSDQSCTKPTLSFACIYFFLHFCCRSSIRFLTFAQSRAQQAERRRPGWSQGPRCWEAPCTPIFRCSTVEVTTGGCLVAIVTLIQLLIVYFSDGT